MINATRCFLRNDGKTLLHRWLGSPTPYANMFTTLLDKKILRKV